jgi:hypothetical protein
MSNQPSRWNSTLALALFLLATLVSAGTGLSQARLDGVGRNATVVRLVQRTSCTSPVVEFEDSRGQKHQFESGACDRPPAYRVGERVPVVHSTSDPSQASIDGFSERWLLTVVFGLVAAVALIWFGVARAGENSQARRRAALLGGE